MVLPVIAVSPKRLTDACTKIFAKQNTAALYSGRKSNFQDLSGSTQRELRRSERKAKQLVLRQPVQHQNRREDRGNIGRNGDTGNAIRNTITKNRLNTTFAIPEITSARNG